METTRQSKSSSQQRSHRITILEGGPWRSESPPRMRHGGQMRIADDIEAIGRRYRELFRPTSEQLSPPKPEPETKSAAETMCPCGWPVSHCFFCVGSVITGRGPRSG